MERNLVPTRAIGDKLPDTLKSVSIGDVQLEEQVDMVAAIRAHIRSQVLRKFGVSSIQRQIVHSSSIGFNANMVQTKLKLPNPLTNQQGVIAENLEAYYKRVLPTIGRWLNNAIANSTISMDQVLKMD